MFSDGHVMDSDGNWWTSASQCYTDDLRLEMKIPNFQIIYSIYFYTKCKEMSVSRLKCCVILGPVRWNRFGGSLTGYTRPEPSIKPCVTHSHQYLILYSTIPQLLKQLLLSPCHTHRYSLESNNLNNHTVKLLLHCICTHTHTHCNFLYY